MAGPRNESMFRKVALDRLASPEQLDVLMEVTGPRTWLALTALGILVGTAVVWGFTGTVPTQVEAQGILIKAGGLFDIYTEGAGSITDVLIREGDTVTKGQVVARIAQPDLVLRIDDAEAELAEQQQEHDRLVGDTRRDLVLQGESIELQRASLEDTIEFSQNRLQALQDQLESEEGLLERGLITRQQVLGTRQAIFTAQDQIERARTQLKQVAITDVATRTQKDEEIIRSQLALNRSLRELQLLEEQYRTQSEVVSLYDGVIVEVHVNAGSLVNRAASIAELQLTGDDVTGLEAAIYIPAQDGKHVTTGMDVQISPLSAPREEYGFLLGRTTYVSEFPASRQGMMRLLANDNLVQVLAAGGAPYVAYATLVPQPDTESGYAWSSPKGGALNVNTGMICRVTITVDRQRPVALVIPVLREKLGL